jgi:hypothetical protein
MLSFHQARDYLMRHGAIQLPYLTNPSVIFTATADYSSKGRRQGQPIIRITSGSQSNILIYEDDWGKKYAPRGKSIGTLIYHACEPLVDYIKKHSS